MRRLVTFVFLLALSSLFVPSQAAAQWIWIGAGGSFPVGDFGDYADPGFLTVAGVGVPIGNGGFAVTGEGFFGQNNHSDFEGDKTRPVGAMVGVEYEFNPGEAGAYLFGGFGWFQHRFVSEEFGNQSDSGLGAQAGGGYGFPLGGLTGWVEGRFMTTSIESETTSLFGLLAGISIPLGGN